MSTPFLESKTSISEEASKSIDQVFEVWSSDPIFNQLIKNISNEFAIKIDDFKKLLISFAENLASKDPRNAWISSCRSNKFLGAVAPHSKCPSTLGRAQSLDNYAKVVSKTSGAAGLTLQEIKNQLLKFSGSSRPILIEEFLKDAPIGRHLIWATFDAANPSANPFLRFSNNYHQVTTALGLGYADSTLILLTWSHNPSSAPLHRPTVADAEDYHFYRPYHDPLSPCGFTSPLSPNVMKLEGQPELVLREVLGSALLFPYQIVHA